MIAALGDLVEDVVVVHESPIARGTDTPARVERRRGGSAANTAVVAASLAGRACFIGQVGDDRLGASLLESCSADNVVVRGRRTGRTGTIVVLVDRDGERSMLPDRGAAAELTDPEESWLDGISLLHVPFYSLAVEPLASTAVTLIGWAHARGLPVSIDLSSSSVLASVGAARSSRLIGELRPDVVFGNAEEIDTIGGLGQTRSLARVAAVRKNGPAPASVAASDEIVDVPARRLDTRVDSTGAGDAFAAGYLVDWLRRGDPIAAVTAGHESAVSQLKRRQLGRAMPSPAPSLPQD